MLRQGEVEVVRLLFRDGAFVGTGFDLVEQDIARPAAAGDGEMGGRDAGLKFFLKPPELHADGQCALPIRLSLMFHGHFCC